MRERINQRDRRDASRCQRALRESSGGIRGTVDGGGFPEVQGPNEVTLNPDEVSRLKFKTFAKVQRRLRLSTNTEPSTSYRMKFKNIRHSKSKRKFHKFCIYFIQKPFSLQPVMPALAPVHDPCRDSTCRVAKYGQTWKYNTK